jgi:hypothetical protein
MGKSFNFKLNRGNILKCYSKQFSNYNSTNNFIKNTSILTYNAATKAIGVPYNNVAASANSILLTGAQSTGGQKF